MKLIIIILVVCVFIFVPFSRFLVKNLHRFSYYGIKDIIKFFKEKSWQRWSTTGVYLYGGLFGCGKTLSVVSYANSIYKNFRNVRFVSNVDLKGVPYTRFVYFEELLEIMPSYEDEHIIYIIDEAGSIFNSRNYKTNKISESEFCLALNTIRHDNKMIILTSQRFGMTDKMFRQVAVHWIECKKFWRVIRQKIYDCYELEYSAKTMEEIKCLKTQYMFCTDKLYNSYDTKEHVEVFRNDFLKGEYHSIEVEHSDEDIIMPKEKKFFRRKKK